MARILFVNPWMQRRLKGKKIRPVGLAYVLSAVARAGIEHDFLDMYARELGLDDLRDRLEAGRYDVVAFGCLVTDFSLAVELSSTIREVLPRALIVAGNSVAAAVPELLLTHSQVDVAVLGEADLTIVELLRAVLAGRPLENVEGLALRRGIGTVRTPARDNLVDKDELPFPDWSLFDREVYNEGYLQSASSMGSRLRPFPLSSARGCPYRCTFCYHVFVGLPYRRCSPEVIIGEMKRLVDDFGANLIQFSDELSFPTIASLTRFVERLERLPFRVPWSVVTLGTLFKKKDIPLIRRMKAAGCFSICFAIENVSEEILQAMGKRAAVAEYVEQIESLREGGINFGTSVIFGYPQETLNSIRKTFEFCRRFGLLPGVGFLQPLPGTPIYRWAVETGHIRNDVEYLMQAGDREVPHVNLTRLPDREFFEAVAEHTARLAAELGLEKQSQFLQLMQEYDWRGAGAEGDQGEITNAHSAKARGSLPKQNRPGGGGPAADMAGGVFGDRSLYKDSAPERTVDRIREILQACAIPASIEQIIGNDGLLHSVGLHLTGFDFHVNGKGVTREYALASAYAELMERLQNHILFHEIEFGDRLKAEFGFIVDGHERFLRGGELPALPEEFRQSQLCHPKENAWNLWERLRREYPVSGPPLLHLPYCNVATGRPVYLPRVFLLNLTGSNGMCAGNTPEEALVQGLCEIFERYALRLLYFEERIAPTVPAAYLKRHAPEQNRLIRALEDSGRYRVLVKDCSFDLGLPVLAVLLVHRKDHRYSVNLGAFPIWQIALERCLAEALQGQRLQSYRNAVPIRMSPNFERSRDFDNYLSLLICSKGEYPASIFCDSDSPGFNGFESGGFASQRDMLDRLIRLISAREHGIFIRDVSFLGFSAFHAVVPGMSEIKMISRANWRETVGRVPVLDYLRRLDRLDSEELSSLADDMADFLSDQHTGRLVSFADYVGMPVKGFLPWEGLPLRLVLAVIQARVGAFLSAYALLLELIAVHRNYPAMAPIRLLLASRDYLGLRARLGPAPSRIAAALTTVYEASLVEEIQRIFGSDAPLSRSLEILSPGFVAPACWDCSDCGARFFCRYREVERIQRSILLQAQRNPIDPCRVARLASTS
jgi:ribosomal protein S12 methylthiotransferase accessory factor